VYPKNPRVGQEKMRKLLLLLAGASLLSACSTVMAPGYTSVEKIYKLKKGMTLSEVDNLLDAPAYDMYVNVENGVKMVEYKYVHRHLKVRGEYNSEANLNQGATRYIKPADLVVVFEQNTGKMLYYYTSTGMADSKNALNQMNQILNTK
jgi:hypothetical protein